jgi:hypothetical protein
VTPGTPETLATPASTLALPWTGDSLRGANPR